MIVDLFKYIFDQSQKDGCKGVISVIFKVAAFFICLSPVFIFFLIYQYDMLIHMNIFISSTLIFGISSILFFIIFSSSKAFATLLLEKEILRKKENNNYEMSYSEKEHYYFYMSFLISSIFQLILSILIAGSHYITDNDINVSMVRELYVPIVILISFIVISLFVWINSLLGYIKGLENSQVDYDKIENTNIEYKDIDMLIDELKLNEKHIEELITVLEKYKSE